MATIVNDKDKILQAATVRLASTPSNFIYFSNAAPVFNASVEDVPTPASYAITALLAGQLTGTVTWSVVSGTVATTGQSGNTWTIAYANLTTDTAVIRASLVYLGVTYSADLTITKVRSSAAISAVVSNEAFVFNAATDGTVSSYTGSGTQIRVYQGASELTYDGVGTANGTWKIATTATNITVGSITDSGTYATVGNHSGVAAGTDTSTITYTLTGKSTTGVAFTIVKLQTFSKSKTGATGTGTAGANGLSSLTAYKVQAQNLDAPTFTATTTGATAPTGWTTTTPTVSVGEVLWYIDGRYNSSTTTISGVAANTTAWTGPIAASIFQDIRSDNWNGTTPPTYGTPSSYGSAGYYISRNTGNIYINNGVFRGDITTSGDAKFSGSRGSGTTITIGGVVRNIDYTSYANSITAASTTVGVGHLGISESVSSSFNVGLLGIGKYSSQGIGVLGSGDLFGGYFTGPTAIGLKASGTTNRAIEIQGNGTFLWNGYTINAPTGSTTTFLRNDGTWATVSGSGTVTSVSGTGTISGLTLTGTVTSSGSLTLGGNLTLTTAKLTATAPGTAYYLNGAGWASTNPIVTAITGNSGSVTPTANTLSFVTGTGLTAYTFTGSGTTMTLQSVSDKRLKENILPETLGLSFVKQLKPVSFKRINQDITHHGFLADDLQEIITDTKDSLNQTYEDGTKSLDYLALIGPLTKAVQELTQKVEELENKLNAL